MAKNIIPPKPKPIKPIPMNIDIQNGQITLQLNFSDAASLARACSIAHQRTHRRENEADAQMFKLWAAMLKSATIAAVAQLDTRSVRYCDELLTMAVDEV